MTPRDLARQDDRFDAVVLAGGRARRLGGVPKPTLVLRGTTLEQHALAAAVGARRTVVVGPVPTTPAPGHRWPPGRDVVRTREDPPFGGPVAGLDAGLQALRRPAAAGGADDADDGDSEHPPWVLLLAVDVPHAAVAVPRLRAAAATAAPGTDGAYLVHDGRPQWLVGMYRHDALRRALATVCGPDGPAGIPVRRLLAPLRCLEVPDDEGLSQDVDTWDDARRLTVEARRPVAGPPDEPRPHSSQEARR